MQWQGEPGRLEVWYTTLTDPRTGTGYWLHTELVAPTDGTAAYVHGWAAVFPLDATPTWERFGPTVVGEEPRELNGTTASLAWDLRMTDPGGSTLYTFPNWAWERQLLPAAQIVPAPAAVYDGTFTVAGQVHELRSARGASARIFGHGNAKSWGWLHADLGEGDVLEVVAAVSKRQGLDRLQPLPFVQLRLGGKDLSPDPVAGAILLKAELGLPRWRVHGFVGRHKLEATVELDPDRSVAIPYTDPDGEQVTCHNSEVASARVRLSTLGSAREWYLDGTAHAEVGIRRPG